MKILSAANLKSLFFVCSFVLILPMAFLFLISGKGVGITVLLAMLVAWLIYARRATVFWKTVLAFLVGPALVLIPQAWSPFSLLPSLDNLFISVRAMANINPSSDIPTHEWPANWWIPEIPLWLSYGVVIALLAAFSVGRGIGKKPSNTQDALPPSR